MNVENEDTYRINSAESGSKGTHTTGGGLRKSKVITQAHERSKIRVSNSDFATLEEAIKK